MRLKGRYVPRESIFGAVETFEIAEPYPHDKYLPSYLILGRTGVEALNVLFAVDLEGDNVRVVTACHPDAEEWQDDMKTRRPKQ
jgi:hypothetical protein